MTYLIASRVRTSIPYELVLQLRSAYFSGGKERRTRFGGTSTDIDADCDSSDPSVITCSDKFMEDRLDAAIFGPFMWYCSNPNLITECPPPCSDCCRCLACSKTVRLYSSSSLFKSSSSRVSLTRGSLTYTRQMI